MADTKQYQKTSSRSASSNKTEHKVIYIEQIMPRLILNPLDTTGTMTQDIYVEGK